LWLGGLRLGGLRLGGLRLLRPAREQLRRLQNFFGRPQESVGPHHDALRENGTRRAAGICLIRGICHQIQAHDPAYHGDPPDTIGESLVFHADADPKGVLRLTRFNTQAIKKQAVGLNLEIGP